MVCRLRCAAAHVATGYCTVKLAALQLDHAVEAGIHVDAVHGSGAPAPIVKHSPKEDGRSDCGPVPPCAVHGCGQGFSLKPSMFSAPYNVTIKRGRASYGLPPAGQYMGDEAGSTIVKNLQAWTAPSARHPINVKS